MDRLKGNMQDFHNIGLIDRAGRFFLGGALLFLGVIAAVIAGSIQVWHAVAVLVSIYPLMTCMMGWDPVYQLLNWRTGSEDGRNVTGTLPYQLDAAVGHRPRPTQGYEYDHSLTGASHDREEEVLKA